MKERVKQILKEHFPKWKVPSAKDLEAGILKHCPNATAADIRKAMHEIVMEENASLFKPCVST